MSKILGVRARQILDSRGNPTIEVDVTTKQGTFKAAVPSGASTGKHEAHELRDGGEVFDGKGVTQAVQNVNTIIAPAIIGKNCRKQHIVDKILIKLDGTKNKEKLGANAILGVSMAVCKAGAAATKIPLYHHIYNISGNNPMKLPVPCMNIINGGRHADNKLDVQECMIIPFGAHSFSHSLQVGTEIYHTLKKILKEMYGGTATAIGDEGGFAPPVQTVEEAIILIGKAIDIAGHTGKVAIGLDIAASEFCKKRTYMFENEKLNGEQLVSKFSELAKKHHLLSIEDPVDQDDWKHAAKITAQVSCQVVGDDILVTNVKRIKKAKKHHACNSLLLKVNQIGTITEAIKAANLAKEYGWSIMVSHRSGETTDAFIADLAVGLGSGQIKAGAPCRGERTEKYNQLLRIEEEMGEHAVFAGRGAFK